MIINKQNIILTGFMGTGKTAVGELLAKRLNYQFVDTDDLIEKRHGMTIRDIFREKGEAAFREMEAAAARELSEKTRVVVATGGRMMLDAENAAVLSKNGRVFCLTAAPEEILRRVSSDTDGNRPLLDTENPGERIIAIIKLLRKREAGYQAFTGVDTTGKTIGAVVEKIISLMVSIRK